MGYTHTHTPYKMVRSELMNLPVHLGMLTYRNNNKDILLVVFMCMLMEIKDLGYWEISSCDCDCCWKWSSFSQKDKRTNRTCIACCLSPTASITKSPEFKIYRKQEANT